MGWAFRARPNRVSQGDAMRIERLGDERSELGECPIWDEKEQALYFTDFNA